MASAARQPRSCTGHPSCELIGRRSLELPLLRKECVLKKTTRPASAGSKSIRYCWKMKHGCQQLACQADFGPDSSECRCQWLCHSQESPCPGSFVSHALTSLIGSAVDGAFLVGSIAASCCSSFQFPQACSPSEMAAVLGLHLLWRLRLGS